MGLSLSVASVKNELDKFFNVEITNELVNQISTIMTAKNEVIFKNIQKVKGIKANFSTIIKNQVIASTVLDMAQKAEVYDAVLAKINDIQDSGGVFATNADVKTLENVMKSYVNAEIVNRTIQDIRQSFDVSNVFKVENDQLIPNSEVTEIDLTMTNTLYNKAVYDTLNKMKSELDSETQQDLDLKLKQKTVGLSNESIIAIALAVGIVGLVVLKKF